MIDLDTAVEVAPYGATHIDPSRLAYMKFTPKPKGRGYWSIWVDDIYGQGDWLKLSIDSQLHCEYECSNFIDLVKLKG